MTFLYLSCIEIALIYLLNIPKELFKRYIGMSLFVNGVVMMISSSLLLQDILFLESLCFFLFYSLKRRITEILFYLSFLLVVKDIIIIFPFYTLISFIIYMTVMVLLVYIKQRYPIDNQNIYWSLLMMISLSTLCIYHILYYDFLEILGVNRHLIILTTLVITMMISYYMFFKYTKLNHEQQLLNQAITYFKNDQQNYAYLEKKNNELYKLKHDLKYDYLQMKQAIKEKENRISQIEQEVIRLAEQREEIYLLADYYRVRAETIYQIVDQKIALLDQEDMLITSGNKLLDSFINMKLEQLQLKKIIPTMIISIQDISFIQDDHLNIIINYLFDLAALCVNHQELQVKIIQDTCVFEITMTMHLGIENIDPVKYDTLKLLLKKYQGSIKIIHENQNLILSLLIPMQ